MMLNAQAVEALTNPPGVTLTEKDTIVVFRVCADPLRHLLPADRDPDLRLRQVLKIALRSFGLRAVACRAAAKAPDVRVAASSPPPPEKPAATRKKSA